MFTMRAGGTACRWAWLGTGGVNLADCAGDLISRSLGGAPWPLMFAESHWATGP